MTGANAEWWQHLPTGRDVTVRSASIELPSLRCRRTATIQGDASVKLESYRADASFEVSADTLAAATDPALSVPSVSDCA